MAKTEERFPMYQSVSELKYFIQKKISEINAKIKKGAYKDPLKAKGFADLMQELLELPYFEMNINVASALQFMKVDTVTAKRELVEFRAEVDDLEYKLEVATLDQDEGDRDSPDFWERISRLNDLRCDLCMAQKNVEDTERALVLIHRLQGIICRPKGFFENLK